MATRRYRSFMLVLAALTTVLLFVGAGMANNASQNQQQSNNQTSEQQGFQSDNQMGSQNQQDQQQYGNQPQQGGFQSGTQMGSEDQQAGTQMPQQPGYQRGGQMGAQGQRGMQANRNQQLERQVAGQLRDQGLGQQGQLLVLAVGNRVILLGAAPDDNEKQQAEQITQQVSGVGQVDNRIVVTSQARRKSDTQLQRDIQQQLSRLPNGVGRNIQVQARNGRIVLRGRVNDWMAMADAIHAAFNAGAPYIVSQITTGQMDRSYGRAGTQQGRSSQMDQGRYGSAQQNQSGRSQQSQGGYAAGQQDRSQYVADWQDQSRSGTSSQSRQDQYGTGQYGRGTTGQYGYQAPGTYDQDQQYDRYDRSRYQGDMDRSRTGQYGRTTGRDRWRQTSEDRQQEQELTSELKSQVQGLEDVTVLVAGNKVFLFGRAQNQSAKDQATSLAKDISGIQRVRNNLIVSTRGMQRLDDSTLRTTITDELQSSPFVENADRIRVNVRNGTATLSGQVDNFGELAAAIDSAYQAGATSVRNRITVSGQPMPGREGEGYYPSYGYGTDQSTSGGYGTQSGTSGQSSTGGYGTQGGTSGQSTGNRATTQNVSYRTDESSASRSMSGQSANREDEADQDDSYPSYGYTPDESDEGESQDTGDTTQMQQMGSQQTSTSDLVLAQRIALELQRQLPNVQNINVLNPEAIYVAVGQNTVTLHGHVQNRNLKQQAEQIARSISGVQNVQNQLIVAGETGAFPPLGYTPGQPSTTTGRSSMGTGQQSTTGQGSMSRQPSTMGQMGQSQTGFQQTSTSDKVLAHQVALELQQQLPSNEIVYVLDTQAINVMVSDGTVMLHGTAPDQSTKQRAEQIAKSVSGARNVQNDLIILGQPQQRQTGMGMGQQDTTMTSTDRRLAQQIQQQLRQQFPGSDINVTISQGTATLHGTVQSQNQKQQAEQTAKSISGVQSVQNNLTVSAAQGAFPPFGYTPPESDTSQRDMGSSSGMNNPDQPQSY